MDKEWLNGQQVVNLCGVRGGHSHKAEGGRKLPHDWPPILKYSYPSVSSCYSSFRSPLGPSLYRKVCLSLSHSVPMII